MVKIIGKRRWPQEYYPPHDRMWCMDANSTNEEQDTGGWAYRVKGMPGHGKSQWWWCGECLRKRGMLW